MAKLQSLSLDMLQTLVCSECLQYLTVLPITVNKNGEIICGRHINFSGGKSLLNTVLENYMFRCINHFEGCEIMLDISTSQKHEQECKFQPHECLSCSFKGNWSQILQHSSKEHALNVTRDCKFNFQIGQETCRTLLYPVNDCIYLCTVNITSEKFCLAISAVAGNGFYTKQCAIKFLKYNKCKNEETIVDYNFFDSRSKMYYEKTIEELTFHFGLNSSLCCQIVWKSIKLSGKALELEKRFSLYSDKVQALIEREKSLIKINLNIMQQKQSLKGLSDLFKKLASTHFKCSNCDTYAEETIYFCPLNHCCCEKCLSNTCTVCKDICQFTKISEFDKIVVSCDWQNCNEPVTLSSYLGHRSSCFHRPYKCPVIQCLDVVYSSQELINHWHCFGAPLKTENCIEIEKYGNYEYYWLFENDLYHVVVKFQQDKLQVIITDNNVLSNPLKFLIKGFVTDSWTEISDGVYLSGKNFLVSNGFAGGIQSSKIQISCI